MLMAEKGGGCWALLWGAKNTPHVQCHLIMGVHFKLFLWMKILTLESRHSLYTV